MLVIISYVSLGLEELMENKGSLMLPQPVFFFFYKKYYLFMFIYLLAALGFHCCMGFSLVVASRGDSWLWCLAYLSFFF